MLVLLEDIPAEGQTRPADRAKAQLFYELAKGSTTRKRLASGLGIRPSTVSQLISEMIADGLIAEGNVAASTRKGRPEIPLEVVSDRVAIPVLFMVSDRIRGVLVDIAGNRLAATETRLSADEADNETLLDAFARVAVALVASKPEHARIPALGISIPGIVDRTARRWIYAARWPRMAGVDFADLERRLKIPVRIERNLNVELRARLQRRQDERTQSVLFVHWGYGIGSVFAQNGRILESSIGGLGEFGHWTVVPHGDHCLCGQAGCLETEAALWALLPRLQKEHPEVPSEEWEFETFLRKIDPCEMRELRGALDVFCRALRNLYMVFFPDRIVLTGPFVQQPSIMTRLEADFHGNIPPYAKGRVTLRAARPGVDDEIVGTALPLLRAELGRLLSAHDSTAASKQ
ncbi:ROK family transcriptional regulator [Consotaella salsifontis]|uniref:Transcriptional regulator of PTS protein n=1 Tax=Consotaella salsifontis TaxID=1365950 RepID=A0A1T4RCB8_9HYPH|nr:ROK family transcriptional regulator [Consotaella salsifontis]SKA13241.1 transcriptional regulator of PTS gene [Consotaella salsifontis]